MKEKSNRQTGTWKGQIGRRMLSILLAFAMVVSMITVFPPTEVRAEGNTVRLYFELPEGTSAGDWVVNAWSNVTVSGGSDARVGGTWGDQYKPTLLSSGDGNSWAYVNVSGNVKGLQFVKWVQDVGDTTTEPTAYNCWNAQIAAKNLTEAYYSPSDNKWYKASDKEEEIAEREDLNCFILAGEENLVGVNWDPENLSKKLSKDGSKYSITCKNVPTGNYSYKILQDPINKGWDMPWGYGTGSDGNRILAVKVPSDVTFTLTYEDGKEYSKEEKNANLKVDIQPLVSLTVSNGNIAKGVTKTLSDKAIYNDGTGEQGEEVSITYTLKESYAGVTLEGNELTVAEDSSLTDVVVVAEYNGYTQEITLPVVDKEYTVTINMCSPDPNITFTEGSSDIHIWENNGPGKAVDVVCDKETTDDDGVTWVSLTTKLPYNNLGIIGRVVKGTWDGGQDGNQYFEISPDKNEATLWYVFGKGVYSEKPVVQMADARYFSLDYKNDTLTTTPQFYSWTIGGPLNSQRIDFTKQSDGTWHVQVPISTTCTNVSYVLVLDAPESGWVKDGGDHFITVPADQKVVYAKMDQGSEPVLAAPYNKGYELDASNQKIHFFYRDDNAVLNGTLKAETVGVEVEGTVYPMTYDAANLRFQADVPIQEGELRYRYVIGADDAKTYQTDVFNENTADGYSIVKYYKLNATVNASVMNASFDYNQNDVVKYDIVQDAADKEVLKVTEASVDLTALGGSKEFPIDPELGAASISETYNTVPGDYMLPVTIVDQFSNVYHTSVAVTVAKRVKKDTNDFDWDESVIYFMVTDRFFDGNKANDTASGANTYGDNEGLYHGGDFAGVTEKLDYLKDLGINTIWITPIVENIPGVTVTGDGAADVPYNAAYHGYWASDFTKLNPTLGTGEEFAKMIEEAHKKGIKIMVDIVVNHAGYDTNFGDMIRSGDDVVAGDTQKDSLSDLPDFRTEDSSVRAKLVEWQTQWIKNYGIDYFRVDTVKHVEGTTWAALKNSLTAVRPEFKMIGEYAGGGYATSAGTLGSGEMDSILDFDFNDQAADFVTGNIDRVESFLQKRSAAINNTFTTGQFLGSHDEDGFKQRLLDSGMDEEAATAASLVAATLQITAKGQPVIYYGEELGQTGHNNYPYQTNRYDFDWSKVNADNKTYQHYKKLLAIRNEYTDVFARGTRKSVVASNENGYDIVSRSYEGTELLVGMNIKNVETEAAIAVTDKTGAVYTDLYSGKTYTVTADQILKVKIPAAADGGTVVLKKTSEPAIRRPSYAGGGAGGTAAPGDQKAEETKTDTAQPQETPSAATEETKPTATTEQEQPTQPSETKSPVAAEKAVADKDAKTGIVATVSTNENGTAVLTKIKATSKKTVVLPSKVVVDGVSYKVTKISEGALVGAKKAKTVELPNTITSIGANAFKGASKLQKIVITSTETIKVSNNAFKGANTKKMTIEVKVSKKGMSKAEFKAFKKSLKKAGYKGKIKKTK